MDTRILSKVSMSLALFAWLCFVPDARAATVVVNDASDTLHNLGCAMTGIGTCTLRDAITFANTSTDDFPEIAFDIPGSGVHTITLESDLPAATHGQMSIGGYSQPGSRPNTNGPREGDNAVLMIEINGNGKECLKLTNTTNTVTGLVINRCRGYGITSVVDPLLVGFLPDFIFGNFIGTDPTGRIARPNGGGVFGGRVGGSQAPYQRNVISGNTGYGVAGSAAVERNLIGLDATGALALPNGAGVDLLVSFGDTPEEAASGAASNVISGNHGPGIVFKPEGAFNAHPVISYNLIGTDVTGTFAVPNEGSGIEITGGGPLLLGAQIRGNVVSGNAGRGITLVGTSLLVWENFIGTDVTGTLPIGNRSTGVWMSDAGDADNTVLLNTIAFNGIGDPIGGGVVNLSDPNDEFTSDPEIRENSIFANTSDGSLPDRGLGIDLGEPGPTPNGDCVIPPVGARVTNFPVLTSALADESGIRIRGTLGTKSEAPTLNVLGIEFFASATCDPSGHGEGQTFLGNLYVEPNADCNSAFDVSLPVAVEVGQSITATVTESHEGPGGHPVFRTSEFSACIPVEPGSSVVVAITGFTPTCGPVGSSLVITGKGFSGAKSVAVGGVSAVFRIDSPTQITATVPAGATTGPIAVTTASDTVVSASAFTVSRQPSLTGFSPAAGPVGITVVITGADLSCASSVTFNGTLATFTLDSPTQITAKVPFGATTGRIAVTTPGGTAVSASNFTVVTPPPTIAAFSPASGGVGSRVVITGANLSGASSVTFKGTAGTFTVNSSTQITAIVPFGAVTGSIAVTTQGGTATSTTVFTVTNVVNALVTLSPLGVSRSKSPVPGGTFGTMTIRATFTNTSSIRISAPFFVVTELSGGNLILNADGGPAGVGARLTPNVGADGILSPGEAFTTDFVVGLQSQGTFSFLVDLRGDLAP